MRESQVLHEQSSRVASEGDQIYKDTQGMKDLVQKHFFQASEKTYQDIYRIEKIPQWDMKEQDSNLIRRYIKDENEVEKFYQLNTYIKEEHIKPGENTENGEGKKVDVNYYNPKSRTFINFSNSRTEEARILKPLNEHEGEKETYQRTLPHSEMMRYIRREAIDEYNQENAVRISEQEKVPDMTFIRHSLSNKEYKALIPELNIDREKPTPYYQGTDQFRKLMREVPNFKAINHFISQQHSHLEVTEITIEPGHVDSAIVKAQTKET